MKMIDEDILNDEAKFKAYSDELYKKLGSIEGKNPFELYNEIFINPKQRDIAINAIAMLAILVKRDKIILEGNVLDISVRCKRGKKFLILNLLLDILLTVDLIEYTTIDSSIIIARIKEKEFCDILNNLKVQLEAEAYKNKDKMEEQYEEIKKEVDKVYENINNSKA